MHVIALIELIGILLEDTKMALETKNLLDEMMRINAGDPSRIQHLIKVHAFAMQIAAQESIPDEMQKILEVARLPMTSESITVKTNIITAPENSRSRKALLSRRNC